MKKIQLSALLLLTIFTFSCSSSEEDDDSGSISNSPLTGTLYGENFTLLGGKANQTDMFGVDSYEIYMTSEDLGCETLGFSAFPITLTVPNSVGTHTSNIYITFSDPNTSDYVSISGGFRVEITSIGERIVGKVKADSSEDEGHINGVFDIAICN